MVIAKETLLRLPEQLAFESPNHDTRVQTLRFLAEAYRRRPHDFLEMEICMGGSAAPASASASQRAPAQPADETESHP